MATSLTGNMRSGSTSRVGAALLNQFRLGAYFKDVVAATGTMRNNQYKWTMTRGVKPLDAEAGQTEDEWTEDQR